MELSEFTKLTEKVEKYQSELDRLKGSSESLYTRLHDEFGVKTLDEAVALLKKLKKRERRAQAIFQKQLKQFESRWSEKIA